MGMGNSNGVVLVTFFYINKILFQIFSKQLSFSDLNYDLNFNSNSERLNVLNGLNYDMIDICGLYSLLLKAELPTVSYHSYCGQGYGNIMSNVPKHSSERDFPKVYLDLFLVLVKKWWDLSSLSATSILFTRNTTFLWFLFKLRVKNIIPVKQM